MSDTSDTAPANAGEKQSRGRFQKSQSGNPAGKRPGTRNRATVLLEATADDDLKAIVTKIVEKGEGRRRGCCSADLRSHRAGAAFARNRLTGPR